MTTIDTSSWKLFKVGDIFECNTTNGITNKNNLSNGNINYVTRSAENNGISGTCGNIEKKVKGNCITIGAEGFTAFYQRDDFVAGNKVYTLRHPKMTEEIGLYLASVLNMLKSKYSFSNARILDKIKEEEILLPVKETEEIDFDYMEKYIENIESCKKNKLESFLKNNNLNKTTISKEEQEILNKNIIYKEFKINKIFEKIETSNINKKANDFPETKNNEYCIPLLTAGIKNNGLARYAKKEDCKTILSKVLSISANGENSGAVFYQENEFAVLQDAYAIKLINESTINKYIGLFLATNLEKAIKELHNWTNKAGWKKIENSYISLPVKIKNNDNHEYTINDIDFDYMEKYIKIIEKQTISKLYKNKLISS